MTSRDAEAEVRYLPRARGDVVGAVEFYESRAAGLGAEFLSTLEHTISGIIAAPHAGSPYEGGTRRVVLRGDIRDNPLQLGRQPALMR